MFCPNDEDCQGRLGLNSDLATVQQMKSGQRRSMARENGKDFRNSQLDALGSFRFSEDPTHQVSSLHPLVSSLHPVLEGLCVQACCCSITGSHGTLWHYCLLSSPQGHEGFSFPGKVGVLCPPLLIALVPSTESSKELSSHRELFPTPAFVLPALPEKGILPLITEIHICILLHTVEAFLSSSQGHGVGMQR